MIEYPGFLREIGNCGGGPHFSDQFSDPPFMDFSHYPLKGDMNHAENKERTYSRIRRIAG
jgi:hypothetical protein